MNVRVIEAVKMFLMKAWSVKKNGCNGNQDRRVLAVEHAYVVAT